MYRIMACTGLLAVVAPLAAAPITLEMASPLKRSVKASDFDKTPPGAIPLTVGGISSMWNATSVRLSGMPMPDGSEATLVLERRDSPIESTWLVGADAAGNQLRRHIPAASVLLLAGTVDGDPGSTVFLGLAQGQAQGWIETDQGLHLISTSPDGGPTLMYRVGADRGGIDVPPPAPLKAPDTPYVSPEATPFVAETDMDRLLLELIDPDSRIRRRFLAGGGAEKIPEMLNLVGGHSDPYQELGACCVFPGFCMQLTADVCGAFCEQPGEPMFTFCDNTWTGPPVDFDPANLNIPPCWLGPGVPCIEQWVCFEPAEAEPDDPPEANWINNWIGACCYPDPVNVGETLFEDKAACECAILGGRFVAAPALCTGNFSPEKMSVRNFISVSYFEDNLDPGVDFCSLPSGACCLERNVFCEGLLEDEFIEEMFEVPSCVFTPQAVCEDAFLVSGNPGDDDVNGMFNGVGGPGVFLKECLPCVYPNPSGGPQLGDGFTCTIEVEDNTQAPLPPTGVRCQTPRIVLDTDMWYLERFNGDIGAAQAYAIMLMGATTFIFERDALVSLQVGELLLRVHGEVTSNDIYYDPDPLLGDIWQPGDPQFVNPYLPGACCRSGDCWQDTSYLDCLDDGGEWQGPGSSCYESSIDCTGIPVNVFEPTVWTVSDTRANMVFEWFQGAASEIGFGYDMVLLLSGFPYGGDAGNYDGSAWGVIPEGVSVGTGATLCTTQGSPFAVAAVNGKFPYPGASFEADDVGWDVVTTSQALALTIGVFNTWIYEEIGLDLDSFRPPDFWDPDGATPDCEFESALGGYGFDSMPATLMSHAYRGDGGSSNVQLRFRTEIAGRIYARLASLDCAAYGSTTAGPYGVEVPDPANPGETITVTVPLAANDILRVYATAGQELDVLGNDVAVDCDSLSDGTLTITKVNGVGTSSPTVQGGTVSIGPSGQFVVYDPPPGGACGLDFFEYSIEIDDPNAGTLEDPKATAWLIHQPVGGSVTFALVPWIPCVPGACCISAGVCVDMPQAQCLATGGIWHAGTACGDPGVPCPPAGFVNPCDDPILQGTWPASYNEPPFAATPPTLPVDPCLLDTMQLDVSNPGAAVVAVGWDGVVSRLVDQSVTQPEQLLLRYWFASLPGGPPDEFVDVRPFADPAIATDCGPDDVTPFNSGTGEAGPSAGLCKLDLPRYVPTQNGVAAVPVQLLVDSDEVPGPDACWIGGSLTVFVDDNGGFGNIGSVGACCVGGLCIETNPFQCADLAGDWGTVPAPYTDSYWALENGFFAGVGTSCDDIDWCRPTAPCCFVMDSDRSCEALTGDDCYNVGLETGNQAASYGLDWGTIGWDTGTFVDATELDGTPLGPWDNSDLAGVPAWGLGCEFPVCSTPSELVVPIAACCVRTNDDTFCTDLTEEACDDFGSTTGWLTTWSIRGECEQVPCSEYGGVSWSAPTGACCYTYDDFDDPLNPPLWQCNDTGSMTFDDCMDAYLTPPLGSLVATKVVFHAGQSCPADCGDDTSLGACCMSLDSFCCVGNTNPVNSEDCNMMGGVWLGPGSSCAACVPRYVDSGVCCLFGLACTTDLNPTRCVAAGGTWHNQFTECREGLPCYGATSSVGAGACCYEYECVDATTPGLQDINEVDCLLGGGRWLGIFGSCNGNPFPPGACDPVACTGVLTGFTVTTFDARTCLAFGGITLVPLGDVNGDGHVGGLADLIPLVQQWGQSSPNADLDGSGTVDVPDLLILLRQWE